MKLKGCLLIKNALYFPYINIPNSKWLTETLLYWDKLSSIVPYEFTQNTNLLDNHMADLHSAGLVDFVMPGSHFSEFNDFEKTFIKIAEIWKSLNRNNTFGYSKIHIEKLGDLGPNLVELGVAEWTTYPWLSMPTPLANIFMTYLATELGKISDLNVTPLTDINGDVRYMNLTEKARIRENILSEILPIPTNTIHIDKLLRFKQDYGHLTKNFRNRIEEECEQILVDNSGNIEDKVSQIKINLKNEQNKIEDSMRSISDDIVFTSIVPLIGTLSSGLNSPQAIFGAGLAVASATYQIVSNLTVNAENRRKPLAYATLVREYYQ